MRPTLPKWVLKIVANHAIHPNMRKPDQRNLLPKLAASNQRDPADH